MTRPSHIGHPIPGVQFTFSPAVVDFAAMNGQIPTPRVSSTLFRSVACLIAFSLIGLCGCTGQRATTADNPSPVTTASYDQTFEASIDVLRDMGFIVDRKDYRFGVVTTRPDVSPTVVEVWHPDNTTNAQALDSTFAHLRRRVTLQLEPVGQSNLIDTPSAYQLRAEVLLERRQEPLRYLTGSTRGQSIVGQLHSVPGEYRREGIGGSYWEPVTRDTALEQRLIRAVQIRAEELSRGEAG